MIVLWMCFDCLSWLSFYFYWEAVKFPYSSTVLYIKLQNILCSTVLKKSETWECKKNLLVSDNRTLNTKKTTVQQEKYAYSWWKRITKEQIIFICFYSLLFSNKIFICQHLSNEVLEIMSIFRSMGLCQYWQEWLLFGPWCISLWRGPWSLARRDTGGT